MITKMTTQRMMTEDEDTVLCVAATAAITMRPAYVAGGRPAGRQ
jgi:hypothetical protein